MEKLITAGLNRYLECDPERSSELKQIDGKVIAVKIRELEVTITFQVEGLKLQEISNADAKADVELNLSIKTLPNYLLGVDRNQLIKNGDIEIIGDTHVASVFHNILSAVEIDWEELLAARIGDTMASQIGFGARKVKGLMRTMRENARLDARDYLQDNLQVAVTQAEVDGFVQQVDILRADVDRLEARLKRLEVSS